MSEKKLSVRQAMMSDHEMIVDYFLQADHDFLRGMGVDISKLPSRHEWLAILEENESLAVADKKFFYVIWLMDDEAVGHSNINKIIPCKEAYMHLHVWRKDIRQRGVGAELVKLSLPYYFKAYDLKELYCEPSAFNPAPNKTLEKCGFEFLKSYDTIPGWINYEQTVNRWRLTRERFGELYEIF